MRKLRWITAALTGHLILALWGAAPHFGMRNGWGELVLELYGKISGTSSRFGFLGARVRSPMRVFFEILEADGQTVTESLESGPGESALHVRQRPIVAAWADAVFARHPGAKAVQVRIEAYEMPSMEEFRQGGEPKWHGYYQASFVPRAG